MQEIKCPNCGELFPYRRIKYEQIVQQVRNNGIQHGTARSGKKPSANRRTANGKTNTRSCAMKKDGEIKGFRSAAFKQRDG